MKFSMTGQEKAGLLIQVTAWTRLIAFDFNKLMSYSCLNVLILNIAEKLLAGR
jgi:hypothetical protein